MGLLRLAALTGERGYEREAEGVFGLFAKTATQHPEAFAHLLRALDFHLSPTQEVALVGEGLGELAAVVRAELRPHLVLAGGPEGSDEPPLLRQRTLLDGNPAAYVCECFSCQTPVTEPRRAGGPPVDASRAARRRFARMPSVSGSFFTFPAGRRAKWIVFAIWFVAIFVAAGPANLPAKFEDAESNEATSYLPGDAESTKALDATESLQNGEIAPR